jgi:hypothetical protein
MAGLLRAIRFTLTVPASLGRSIDADCAQLLSIFKFLLTAVPYIWPNMPCAPRWESLPIWLTLLAQRPNITPHPATLAPLMDYK